MPLRRQRGSQLAKSPLQGNVKRRPMTQLMNTTFAELGDGEVVPDLHLLGGWST